MKKTAHQKTMDALNQQMSIQNREGDLNRARSVTVGTSFGGTTELMMRMNSGQTVWAPMQPVEIIELIHQLAANVGCHIALKPREDFASWRKWKADSSMISGGTWPPFVNDMEPHKSIGMSVASPIQPELTLSAKEQENGEIVAIEKTVKRRNTKRAATPT
jgi:hypothetical protein